MNPLKVSTILDRAQPTSLYHVRLFPGFCNFYRCVIQDFSKLAKPLICHDSGAVAPTELWKSGV